MSDSIHEKIDATRIARCAIDHYNHTLPSNNGGKPQAGKEWTVFAAVVACRSRPPGEGNYVDKKESENRQVQDDDQEEMWVVSCATGSKCTSIRSTVSSFPPPNTIDKDYLKKNTEAQSSDAFDDVSICRCYNGMVLKDSHAETLARRGFLACLWNEIEYSLEFKQSNKATNHLVVKDDHTKFQTRNLLEAIESLPNRDDDGSSLLFRMKPCITLHFYVSDSPCGDAAIYEVRKRYNLQTETNKTIEEANGVDDTELNFTGAKIILGGDEVQQTKNKTLSESLGLTDKNSGYCLGRENVQTLGALRIKSSRSNIPPEKRTTSMSCSDKILRWGVLGLQGSLLSIFIPEPICFSSVCVSKDARSVNGGVFGGQSVALERALQRRIENALNSNQRARNHNPIKPPTVAVVDVVFESSKSAADYRYFLAQANTKKRIIQHTFSTPKKVPKVQDNSSFELCPANEETVLQHNHLARRETACGLSINWHQSFRESIITEEGRKRTTEITVGALGLKRGKKPKTPNDVLGSASRLCRLNFLHRSLRCAQIMSILGVPIKGTRKDSEYEPRSHSDERCSYQQFKQMCSRYKAAECFNGPMMGYLRSGHADDFVVPSRLVDNNRCR